MSRHAFARIVIAAFLLAAAPAAAQDTTTSPEELGRFRFGPIRFTPAITVSSLGVDTNVFNDPVDPKQDFTAAFGPKVSFWMRAGRGLLSGEAGLDYFYFQEYDTQRSFGTTDRLRFEMPVGRLTPFVEGHYVNTRQRPSYEIDARSRREQIAGRGGLDLRVGGKTTLRAAGGHETFRFTSDDVVAAALREELDRDTDTVEFSVRQQLTPLTTFVVKAEQNWDRFIYSTFRDADGLKVMPGFEFKPFALVDGSVFVGYRSFRTLSADVPDYSGVAANADLGYALRATKFVVRLTRDVTYSFDDIQPYYVLTDAGLTVTQRITTHWDVMGRGQRGILDYQAVGLASALQRKDHVRLVGFGVGYRFGETARVGVDADYVNRDSDLAWRTYDGWRIGGTVSYGVKQR